ncbi:MAG: hypothetical protein WBP64_14495 [Nitrososphaeraceae archaeon]
MDALNGVLMAGGAMAPGVPTPTINGGLRTLADQTGCDNIVKWDIWCDTIISNSTNSFLTLILFSV